MNFQSEKQVVLNFYNALEDSKIDEIPKVLSNYCSKDILWWSFHPFNEIRGIEKILSILATI